MANLCLRDTWEGFVRIAREEQGGVMIITKECYKIVDADITVQNENESVWAIITLDNQCYPYI